MKKWIYWIVEKLGYRIERITYVQPIDVRKLGNNPRSLFYLANNNRQVLITASIKYGRGLDVLPLSAEGPHPFVYAVRVASLVPDPLKAIENVLRCYYRHVQPLNVSQWLGLDDSDQENFVNLPAWVSLLPWENVTVDQKKLHKQNCAAEDNIEHGHRVDLSGGWRNFGPVSNEVLLIEVRRLYSLMTSIKENGLLRHDGFGGDIGANILMREDGAWRWLVEWGGQHRAAVLSALDFETIPIRVWQIIERKDVDIWPNVLSGVYTRDSALKVFDQIFNGEVPRVVENWHEYID